MTEVNKLQCGFVAEKKLLKEKSMLKLVFKDFWKLKLKSFVTSELASAQFSKL